MSESPQSSPSRGMIALAFGAVYVIWGSTYLGIRYAIATIPPFVMAGCRFLTAGALLYAFARQRGAPPPRKEHLAPAALIGALMLLVGNGGVVFAERTLPSGLAALLVATEPLFITAIDSVLSRRLPPPLRLLALAIGFVAVGLLVDPATLGGGDVGGVFLVLVAAMAWAVGTLYQKRAARPASGALSASLQMLFGGALQLLLATVLGEWSDVHLAAISTASLVAVLYLVFFGSIVAYTAYSFLIQSVSPALVSTYAYVNPVVAVFLGWLVVDEPISARTLIAAAMIIGSIGLLTASPMPARARAR